MTPFLQDLRHGVRILFKNPGFSAVAVLTLALGIGANSTIFSFLHTLLFRPLPGVVNPGELVFLEKSYPYLDYLFYRDNNTVFSGLFAQGGKEDFILDTGDRSEIARGELVTANYFSVLGVNAALGRTFLPEEGREIGSPPVVVVSHGLWQRCFGSDPGVIGRAVRVDGFPLTIVGVTPPGFTGNEVGLPRDLWVPLTMQPQVAPHSGDGGPDSLSRTTFYWLNVVGRLKPGVRLRRAEAEINTLVNRRHPTRPDDIPQHISLFPVNGGLDPRERGDFLPAGAVLFALVGLVLFIACSNVANFLLARAAGRRKEVGIRLALGSTRRRLISQLLTENLPLALFGGLGGLLLALWLSDFITAIEFPGGLNITLDLRLDAPVLLFTLGASFAAVLLCGLIPALHATRADVVPALKDESSARFRRSRLRDAFVVAQVSLSLVLLVSAGLFVHSLAIANRLDPGFSVDSGLVIPFRLLNSTDSSTARQGLFREALDNAASLPGVASASLVRFLPLGGVSTRSNVARKPDAPHTEPYELHSGFNVVAPRYFETIDLPILRGREFTSADTADSPPVVIINQTLADRLWPGEDPVGKHLLLGGTRGTTTAVVGVARNALYERPGERPLPFYYQPLAQTDEIVMTLIARTISDPRPSLPLLHKQLAAGSSRILVLPGRTLRDHLDSALSPARLAARALSSLGLVALGMAAVGIFGVMAHSVSQRTREMGIRIALGAAPREIRALILREGMRVVAVGIALGFLVSAAVAQLFSSFLIGIAPWDPLAFLGVTLLLAAVALAACWLPARRATRVDPMVSLRYE